MRGPHKMAIKKKSISVTPRKKSFGGRKKTMLRTAKRARPKRPATPKMPKDALGMGEAEPMPGEDTEAAL